MELESGEQVIFEGHPSWRSIIGFYIKGLLIGAVVAAVARLVGSAGARRGRRRRGAGDPAPRRLDQTHLHEST